MTFKKFLLVTAIMGVAACSGNKDKQMQEDLEVRNISEQTQGIGEGNVGSAVLEDVEFSSVNNATPGSQEDLVVNIGDRVYFGYDRYDLTTEARQQLELQAQWMQRYPNISVTIEGHADERGTREYNLALGERRANAVKSYLTALGISPSRVSTVSYGKERPVALGSNPQAWAQNRRGVTSVN